MSIKIFYEMLELAVNITSIDAEIGSREMIFYGSDGIKFRFYSFEQSCGNDVSVWIEDIVGDLQDLLGSPIIEAEEISSEKKGDQTWTFYRFGTAKGTVTVRWFGESNGYYSEKVEFYTEWA